MPNPRLVHCRTQHYAHLTQSTSYVLVTGATGFIGSHVVDTLLRRGYKVRGSARSKAKADEMLAARPQWKDQLDFVEVADFEGKTDLTDAVKGVDGIIHVASVST